MSDKRKSVFGFEIYRATYSGTDSLKRSAWTVAKKLDYYGSEKVDMSPFGDPCYTLNELEGFIDELRDKKLIGSFDYDDLLSQLHDEREEDERDRLELEAEMWEESRTPPRRGE